MQDGMKAVNHFLLRPAGPRASGDWRSVRPVTARSWLGNGPAVPRNFSAVEGLDIPSLLSPVDGKGGGE